MKKVSKYTNSTQHNVIATAIHNLNETNGLTYIDKTKIGSGTKIIIDNPMVQLSTLNAMTEILNAIHDLGYQITKKNIR